MNIHETHNEYICDEVIRKHTRKILGCKIQDSERRKANGTEGGIQKKSLNLSVIIFLVFKRKS